MVKRAVRSSERTIGGSRGQLEGLRGQLENLGDSQRVWEASQRVWEASQGVWRVKLEGWKNIEKNEDPDLPCAVPLVIDPFRPAAQKAREENGTRRPAE